MKANKHGYTKVAGKVSEKVDNIFRTIDDIAKRSGYARGAVRQHLEDMLKKGKVEKSRRVAYRLKPKSRPTGKRGEP